MMITRLITMSSPVLMYTSASIFDLPLARPLVGELLKRLSEEARKAVEVEDFLSATELIDRATALRPGDYRLRFLHGVVAHRSGDAFAAHEAYREVVRLLSERDQDLPLGGAAISFRGVATAAALATSHALARSKDLRVAWRDRVVLLARAGYRSFEQRAHALSDRRMVRRIGRSSLLPAKRLSAALNFYLAGQLAGSSLMLEERCAVQRRTGEDFADQLRKLSQDEQLAADRAEIGALLRIGTAQLAPLRSPALSWFP